MLAGYRRLSSDKERQFTRLAKISHFVYLGAIALYTSYFILHPKVRYCSLLFLSSFVTCPSAISVLGVLHFFDALGTLGFGILFNVSMAIPVKDEALTGEINTYTVSVSSFIWLVSLGYIIHMKNKDIQRRLTEEFSAEGSFANEKVPDQGRRASLITM
ncbi:hypothetical protein DL89DRAFT_268681 [Linderina pennispora]|uniref:Uncharacterized protein n=1 Tax=Linderina pennispora TaxID=61395 RepID=A0A1Y1W3N2_9FUNG|nr:uncharacterized protein DL89DRAFT_268681 [Linderina pennispora]ORX68141.1 hypothetical protein DL89DRAFT_268681 [Linderina pennispora]